MVDPNLVTDLLIELRTAGVRLAQLSVQKPSLDEVFLAITGVPTLNADDKEVAA
jgi:ABC-2 type transport system ATP-binding protein